MVLHRPVELAGIIGIWRRHAIAIFDAFRWPDYHAARDASTVSAPLFVSRFASLFFLFWRSRIDRSGGVEQGARTHFWPHGVRGRHSPRRIHGGTCLGQRVDRTSRRRLGPADRALRVVGTRRCRDCRNFSRGTGGRPRGLCRRVSLRGRKRRRFAGAAICGIGAGLVLADISDGRHAARAGARTHAECGGTGSAPVAPLLDQHGGRGCRNIRGGISFSAFARPAAHAGNRCGAESGRGSVGADPCARRA